MKFCFAAVVPLLLAGCTPPAALPESGSLTRAADPVFASPVPDGPIVQFTARAITEPADWRKVNDAQAPGGGS